MGYARNAARDDERAVVKMWKGGAEDVDMYTVVLVGSSASGTVAGRFAAPRGYTWRSAAETVS